MNFEPLERRLRNWRRTRTRVKPADLPEPFHPAPDIRAVRAFFAREESATVPVSNASRVLTGTCQICEKRVEFSVDIPEEGGPINWRETLSCPHCGLINRWRGCIHLFEAVCQPTEQDRIYVTESLSPVFDELAARYPLLVGSEYIPQAPPGEVVELHGQQVRNEDVTRLHFDDRCLEAVLCFDVLEHVPDYRRALREFCRVLVPGGQLVLSVPFSFLQQTIVRAVIGPAGTIEHLQPPCYHGDPLSPGGVLSYYDFGMDLLDEMKRAGFTESFLVCYRSAQWGYLQNNVAFVARRLRR